MIGQLQGPDYNVLGWGLLKYYFLLPCIHLQISYWFESWVHTNKIFL